MTTATDTQPTIDPGPVMPVVSQYADEETQKKLIAACNLLCEHADNRLPSLPSLWEIRLSMFKGEATMSLIAPNGEEVFSEAPDWGIASIDDLCVIANERFNDFFEDCAE